MVAGTATFQGHLNLSGPNYDPTTPLPLVSLFQYGDNTFRSANVDSAGNFTIAGVPAGTYSIDYSIPRLMSDAYVGQHFFFGGWPTDIHSPTFTVADSQTVTVPDQSIPAEGTISGKMIDPAGNPLSGLVEIWEAGGWADNNETAAKWVRTLRDGTYSIPWVVAGSYKVGFTEAWAMPFDGSLAPSSPYAAQWYSNKSTYSTGDAVSLSSQGQTVGGINATMGAAPPPLWAGELASGSNPAESNCQCGEGDPVDTATGSLEEQATDLSIAGSGPGLQVARGYSSLRTGTDSPFGQGWTASFGSRVSILTLGSGPAPASVSVTQENGSTVVFTSDASGTYSTLGRAHATLARAGDGTWTFTRLGSEVLVFSAAGALTKAVDSHGTAITYAYDANGKLATMTASGSRTVSLTWAGNHVTKVTDSAGRSVSYGYDTSNDLTSFTAADGSVVAYGYDTAGNLTSITQPGSATTTNTYDSSHRVTVQADPLNRKSAFAYSDGSTTITKPDGTKIRENYSGGLLSSRTVAVGTAMESTTTYSYDSASNLVIVVDPRGYQTLYGYDAAGNRTTSTPPSGSMVTQVYDSNGRVTSVRDSSGNTTSFVFDSAGNQTRATSPGGRVNTWTYNPDGTAATSVDADGKTTAYTYDSAGRLLSTTDPAGRVTRATYSAAGFRMTSTDGAGDVTTYTRDPLGRVLTSKDALGKTTAFSYDARGNQTKVTDPLGNSVSATYDADDEETTTTDQLGKVTTLTYTANGQLATTTDPDSHKVTRTYDGLGDLSTSTDSNTLTTSYAWDLDGHETSETSPAGEVASFTYNSDGYLVSTTNGLGKTTSYGVDAEGRRVYTIDPTNKQTSQMVYSVDGDISKVYYPNGSSESFTWNGKSEPLTYTNPDGQTTTYTYDDAGVLRSRTEPGNLVTSYTSDGAGRLETTTNPDGSVSTNAYDAAGRLLSNHSSAAGSTDTSYTYDADGRRTAMTDGTGGSTYGYDARGELTSYKNAAGSTVGYAYDPAGLMTAITYPGNHTVTYAFDAAGRMSSVSDWASHKVTFGWDKDGRLSTQTDPNGVTETRTWDAASELLSISDLKGTTNVAKFGYTYAADGTLATETSNDSLNSSLKKTYKYDTVGQLTSSVIGSTTTTFTASPARQLTSAAGETLTYNTAQELTTRTPASGAATTYAYNANGARTSAISASATTAFGYSPSGGLASVILPSGGGTITFKSDGDGLRQSRTKGTTTSKYTWDVSSSLPLLLDDSAHTYVYGPDLTPVMQVDDSTAVVTYLHSDLLGSVREITSSTGTVVGANAYDQYGKRTTHTGTVDSGLGFTGALQDTDTGLLYLRARDYDPTSRQFIQRDPAVDVSRTPYAYANNNPVEATDPTGLCYVNGGAENSHCTPADFDPVLSIAPWLLSPGASDLSDLLTHSPGVAFLEGAADGVTFGLTGVIRRALAPQADCIMTASGFYTAGEVTGVVLSALPTDGASLGAHAAEAAVSRAAEEAGPLAPATATAKEIIENATRGPATGTAGKIPWTSYANYSKVTVDGGEYAQVGDRLYTQHAVDRMQPSGLGAPAGATGPGRSISPNFVEDVIRTGTPSQSVVDGVTRTIYSSGTVQVVTEDGGQIVVTVLTK